MRLLPQLLVLLSITASFQAQAQSQVLRARDLGVPFPGTPGRLNAITDVAGIEVGHTTLISGEGRRVRGQGPIRTGVTAIHPRGKDSNSPVFGGWFTLNASGEMTGTTWLEERGLVDGPIMITNTHSVGIVRDAAVRWMVDRGWTADWHAPIAAETYDGRLNDINGFHVTAEHALQALLSAVSGPVAEGSVGGGTGMICNRFKGGIGTASRLLTQDEETYTVGVLVQCNYGRRDDLKHIAGIAVPELIDAPLPCYRDEQLRPTNASFPACNSEALTDDGPDGSIIAVIATDAPLLPHQLKRVAKRPSLAIGRLGAVSGDGSGDIFIAFSTAFAGQLSEESMSSELAMIPNNQLTQFFKATVEATEEAIVNAMVAAETMEGADSLTVFELPEQTLADIFNR